MPPAHTHTGPTSLGATTSPCNKARLNTENICNANSFLNQFKLHPYPGLGIKIQVSDNIYGNGQPSFTFHNKKRNSKYGLSVRTSQ